MQVLVTGNEAFINIFYEIFNKSFFFRNRWNILTVLLVIVHLVQMGGHYA
jgi:hypothetical protein